MKLLENLSVFKVSPCDSISSNEHWGDFSPHACAPGRLTLTPINYVYAQPHPKHFTKDALVVLTPTMNTSYVAKCSLVVKKSGVKWTLVQIPPLPIPPFLTLTELLKLSTSQFLQL